MKFNTCLFYGVFAIVLVACIKIYYESDAYNLKCVISTIDGKRYCVRDRHRVKPAADLLAKATQRCIKLVSYMEKNYMDKDVRAVRLVNGFNPDNIMETLPTSELTAYSENKGEKLAFCLNRTKSGTKLIDLHTLTFVAIHELSHIMTKSQGHKQEFWQNFKFLLEKAQESGIYKSTDYKNSPVSYCGLEINDNPYYDLI
jgi:hypothetical protein